MKITYNKIIKRNVDFDDRLDDKGIRFYDIVVGIALLLIIITHITTNIIVMKTVSLTGAEYSDVVKTHEVNPVAKWLLLLGNVRILISIILIPSVAGGLYYVIRLSRNKYYVAYTSVFYFLVAVLNVTNDLSVLLGLMLR